MIPLMFIQKPEELLVEGTISITDMTPIYKHSTRTIEIEMKYNLDEFMQIRVILNEFDQPKYIYLKTNKITDYIEVTSDVNEYVLDGNYITAILTYNDIVDIVNNTLKDEQIEQWDIKAKLFNRHKLDYIKMDSFSIHRELELLQFTINGKSYEYRVSDYMPVLEENGKKIDPEFIYGYYYVFNIKVNDEAHKIALLHPRGFVNHYLFTQTTATHSLTLLNKTIKDNYLTPYMFMNGSIIKADKRESLQYYSADMYKQEYKQYLLNAAIDTNLYTEIANAFNIAKHHSMVAYDYKENRRIMAKIEAYYELNKYGEHELVLETKNPRDQFNVPYEKVIKFRIPKVNVLKLYQTRPPYKLLDLGYFEVDGEFLPVALEMIYKEAEGYITASNMNLFISVSKSFLEECIVDSMQTLTPTINVIEDNAIINSDKIIKEIDYENRTITLNNVNREETFSFDDVPNNDFIVDKDVQLLSSEGLQTIFGIDFKVPPLRITMNPVTPDQFDYYFLLIKHTEPVGYSYNKLESEVVRFAGTMKIEFIDREFAFVYNFKKNKIYTIDLTNQDANQEFSQVNSTELYFKGINENKLGSFLSTGSIYNFVIKDGGYGISISKSKDIIPYVIYRGINGNMFSNNQGLLDNSSEIIQNYGFRTRNINLSAIYDSNNKVMREDFRGIFTSNNIELIKVEVSDSKISIYYELEGKDKTIDLSLKDGEFVYYDVIGNKKTLPYSEIQNSTHKYGSINAIYDENTNSGIAVDVNIIKKYIDNQDLRLNNELCFVAGDNVYFKETDDSVTTFYIAEPDVEYNNKSYAVIEEWFGKELFDIISITNEYNNNNFGEAIKEIDVYKDDTTTIHKIDKVIAKYISIY